MRMQHLHSENTMSFDISQVVDFVTTYSQHIDWVSTGEVGGGAVVVIGLLAVLAKKAKKKKRKGDDSTMSSESFHQTTLERADTEDIKNEFDNITMQTQEFDASSEFTADGKKHELSVTPTLSPTDEEEHLLNSAFETPATSVTRSHQLLDEALVLDSYGRKPQALTVLHQAIEATTNSREKLRLKVIAQSYQDKPYAPDLLMNLTESMPSFVDREGNPVTSLKDVRNTSKIESEPVFDDVVNNELTSSIAHEDSSSALPFVAIHDAVEETPHLVHDDVTVAQKQPEEKFDFFKEDSSEESEVAPSVVTDDPDSFLHKPAVRNLWDRVQQEENQATAVVEENHSTIPVSHDDSFDFDFTTRQVSENVELHAQPAHGIESPELTQQELVQEYRQEEITHSIFENANPIPVPVAHEDSPIQFKLADEPVTSHDEPLHFTHEDTETVLPVEHHEVHEHQADEELVDTSMAAQWALMQQSALESETEQHHHEEVVAQETQNNEPEQFKLFNDLQETPVTHETHHRENSAELLQAILAEHPENEVKEKEPEQLNLFSDFDMASWDQNKHVENQTPAVETHEHHEDEAQQEVLNFEHAQQWDNHKGFELVKENHEASDNEQGNIPVEHTEEVSISEEHLVAAEHQAEEEQVHEAPQVSHMIDQTITKLIQEAEAHELVSPDTLEEEQQSNQRFWEAFGDMANDLNKEMPTRTETILNGPSKLTSPPERDTIWVNWMAQIDGKASLRNNFIELEHAWGTRSAVEELHRFLTHYAGRDDENLPNSWAVLSVYVVR
jgi:hypothetical protein